MNHRTGRILFALIVGGVLAWLAWHSGTTPEDRQQRALEESMVRAARSGIAELLGDDPNLQIVDPLHPNRVAGKVFVYPADGGFQVSGYYRRRDQSPWYPWLATMDAGGNLRSASLAGPDGRRDVKATDIE